LAPENLTLITALSLGFLHALEVDHMVAVTTFVAGRPALSASARFGFLWGVGHSIAVLLAGGLLLVTGLRWPERYDVWGEGVVGVMLVGLGTWALRSSRALHLHPPADQADHGHLHAHGPPPSSAGHDHGHEHASSQHVHHHRHGHGITLVGLLHGLSGTSAAVALVPVTLIHRLDYGFGYLLLFGVGVTGGMMVYATIAALAMRQAAARSLEWGRKLGSLVGLAGIAVGVWWIWGALHS
jgi:ABC-type nickel/cobalt efflux system permease component RcnA